MILKNPCKKCLVRPICRSICYHRRTYTETYKKIQKNMKINLFTSIFCVFSLTMLILEKTHTNLYWWVSNAYLFYISLNLFVIFKCFRNIKYNERFLKSVFSSSTSASPISLTEAIKRHYSKR